MHKEPHGIWRVDYQLPPGETPEDALRPESLQQRIDAQLKMIGFEGTPWEMDWSSVYSARTLTLPDYVHDRIVFTGDAAPRQSVFTNAMGHPDLLQNFHRSAREHNGA